jgi:N-acetylneuraminic acid mutarotase
MRTNTHRGTVKNMAPRRLGKHSWLPIATAGYLFAASCLHQAAAQKNAWTWIGGNTASNQPGNYGTLGKSAAANLPPARWSAASWIDKDGNLWLFGGSGYDPVTGGVGTMTNDLWEYSPFLKQWTWMGGSKIAEARIHGVYGTRGEPGKANTPGARTGAVSWTDKNGNFWLFGGGGYDAMGHVGDLNDLWRYSPSTHQWTWICGSATVEPKSSRPGLYGTLGVFTRENVPGAREQSVSWKDSAGNLWLFGGTGNDADANVGALNDLWEYRPDINEWAWMGGSEKASKSVGWPGVYGIRGAHTPGINPGSRSESAAWTDETGDLWLFGGGGYDKSDSPANLNDLWEFSQSIKAWIWQGGSDISLGCSKNNSPILDCKGQPGIYGKLGEPADGNTPGGRAGAVAWKDANGNFWLFGGQGFDSAGNRGSLNDLWEFNPHTHFWTWFGGSSTESGCRFIPAGVTFCEGRPGEYGAKGVPDPASHPGARTEAAAWVDKQRNLWLFGGYGMDSLGKQMGVLNDLWEYQQSPAANTPLEKPRSTPSPSPPPKPKRPPPSAPPAQPPQ